MGAGPAGGGPARRGGGAPPPPAAAGAAGTSAAARACPISQRPLTTRTAPTYSSITPSIGSSFGCFAQRRAGRPSRGGPPVPAGSPGRSIRHHPRRRRLVPVRPRPPALLARHLRLVRALLLPLERSAYWPLEPREARRGEDPPRPPPPPPAR